MVFLAPAWLHVGTNIRNINVPDSSGAQRERAAGCPLLPLYRKARRGISWCHGWWTGDGGCCPGAPIMLRWLQQDRRFALVGLVSFNCSSPLAAPFQFQPIVPASHHIPPANPTTMVQHDNPPPPCCLTFSSHPRFSPLGQPLALPTDPACRQSAQKIPDWHGLRSLPSPFLACFLPGSNPLIENAPIVLMQRPR